MGGRLVILLLLLTACAQDQAMTVEDNVTELNNIGFLYAQQGNNEEAKEYFEKVLNLDLAHEVARKNLALIYYQEGEYEKAIEQYIFLVGINPNEPAYHYDLGINVADNCRINNICKLEVAIMAFEQAEKLSPGFQNAKQNIEALKTVMKTLNEEESQE